MAKIMIDILINRVVCLSLSLFVVNVSLFADILLIVQLLEELLRVYY